MEVLGTPVFPSEQALCLGRIQCTPSCEDSCKLCVNCRRIHYKQRRQPDFPIGKFMGLVAYQCSHNVQLWCCSALVLHLAWVLVQVLRPRVGCGFSCYHAQAAALPAALLAVSCTLCMLQLIGMVWHGHVNCDCPV